MINFEFRLKKVIFWKTLWLPPGGGQPAQDKDVVPDQRHQEHDRRQEDPAIAQDERQAEGGES